MPCDNVPGEGEPKVCDVGGSGLILPLGGDWENDFPYEPRIPFYLLGLLWCFLGVAIIADIFMGAIEKITSKKKFNAETKRTETVWNATVANLSLMALGSSAPEILLNVIGIFPYYLSGDLGPSTIVGSAAFNLLVIIAVCVVSIPNNEVRKIKTTGVYIITACFSIFAYIWLLVILLVSTPDVVEVWEGVITFCFFWVLLVLAFLADKGKLPGTAQEDDLQVGAESSMEDIAQMEMAVRQKYGKTTNLTPDMVAVLIDHEYAQGHSRAVHRVAATRALTGGKKVLPAESSFLKGAMLKKQLASSSNVGEKTTRSSKPEVSFKALNFTVLESVGKVEIAVHCIGTPTEPFSVKYKTKDGSAKAVEDYVHKEGEVTFSPTCVLQTIPIEIVNTEGVPEDTEEFYLELLQDPAHDHQYELGSCSQVTIVIIDEDLPGEFSWEKEVAEVTGTDKDEIVPFKVLRKKGSSGRVTCKYSTEGDTAVEGKDFEAVPADSEVVFENGQTDAIIPLKIFANGKYESTECFRIYLTDPSGGASFDRNRDGGKDGVAILTVMIIADEANKSRIDIVKSHLLSVNYDSMEVGTSNWQAQFIAAFWVGGSKEDQKEASCADWVLHIVSLPWKLLFACVPPTEFGGGWVCFCCALGMVGFVTCIIGDLAELLGCVMKISPGTTAITFVALGTSLPDTFASRTAAKMDPYADNSIGNVTGSNSVNVFLGLGLPWMICAIYWVFIAECQKGDAWHRKFSDSLGVDLSDYETGIFVVPAGALSTSVLVFCICGVTCLLTLAVRRKLFGGELGGPQNMAYATAAFFVCLWFAYVGVSVISDG